MKREIITGLFCIFAISGRAQNEIVKVDEAATTNWFKSGGGHPAMLPKPRALVFNANTPAPALTFNPTITGVDPMIAAGDEFLIVSQDHRLAFYQKDGTQLGSDISSTDFFQDMIDAANDNQFSWLGDAPHKVTDACNTDSGGEDYSKRWLNEAYDTRVVYEPVNKRFIIVSAVRNTVWRYKANANYNAGASSNVCDKWAVRIFAFAISKTNDPRDGFYKWYWTKNNYRDWPRIYADQDVLTVAHNGGGPSGVITPSIYVISLKDMIAAKSNPRYFTYMDDDYPGAVIPVNMYKKSGSAYSNFLMYVRANGSKAELYYLKKSSDMWTNKPDLDETDIDLGTNLDLNWQERPAYRNGKIYMTNIVSAAAAVKNKRPDVYGFWLYRLPLSIDGDDISFNESSSLLMKQHYKPTAASGTNYESYDMPSLAVNSAGTILAAYGRWAKTGSSSFINPESRYFEHIEGETNHRNSHVLKAGDATPQFKQTGWTANVVDGFYHSYSSDVYLDYTTVVADPSDSKVFWIANSYANSGKGYKKMIIGKIKADK